MGLTAIIGDALTDHAAHLFGLFIDGLDVIKEHATPSRFAVPIDSISVTEAGPGGVSSMSFIIDDPNNLLAIADGARIEYWDLTNNWPIFAGYLQVPTLSNSFGDQGTSIGITAFGLESLLDTIIVPSLTFHGSDMDGLGVNIIDSEVLQVLAGFTPFRAGSLALSTQANPVTLGAYQPSGNAAVAVLDGLSVRQAQETYIGVCAAQNLPVALTVDFYGGIRYFYWGGIAPAGGTNYIPTDYATLTLSDTSAGAIAAENISYERDLSPNALINAVYVKGAAAASTGWVVGDTTTGRREAYTTTAGTTEADKQAAANLILITRSNVTGRGSFELTDFTPINAHPGSRIVITDARRGWVAKTLLMTEISKTFKKNGKQDWHVSFTDPAFGAASGPPSAARLMRTLTRGTN